MNYIILIKRGNMKSGYELLKDKLEIKWGGSFSGHTKNYLEKNFPDFIWKCSCDSNHDFTIKAAHKDTPDNEITYFTRSMNGRWKTALWEFLEVIDIQLKLKHLFPGEEKQ